MTSQMCDALDRGAADQIVVASGLRWPTPLVAPPLVGEHLGYVAERLRSHDEELGWWFWAVAAAGRVVGAMGFGGPPDPSGCATIGYSVYPADERRGYATEAVSALVDWAFVDSRVARVRATMLPDNTASMRVARKVGMRRRDLSVRREEGELIVYELERRARPQSVR